MRVRRMPPAASRRLDRARVGKLATKGSPTNGSPLNQGWSDTLEAGFPGVCESTEGK